MVGQNLDPAGEIDLGCSSSASVLTKLNRLAETSPIAQGLLSFGVASGQGFIGYSQIASLWFLIIDGSRGDYPRFFVRLHEHEA